MPNSILRDVACKVEGGISGKGLTLTVLVER